MSDNNEEKLIHNQVNIHDLMSSGYDAVINIFSMFQQIVGKEKTDMHVEFAKRLIAAIFSQAHWEKSFSGADMSSELHDMFNLVRVITKDFQEHMQDQNQNQRKQKISGLESLLRAITERSGSVQIIHGLDGLAELLRQNTKDPLDETPGLSLEDLIKNVNEIGKPLINKDDTSISD